MRRFGWIAVVGAIVVAALVSPTGESASAAQSAAIATLRNSDGSTAGTVRLAEAEGGVLVRVDATGLPAGFHGFHVHDVGECTGPSFTSSGGHYNPTGAAHRDHTGDLPVLLVNRDGNAHAKFVTDRFTIPELVGANVAFVVHANPDNYANIPATDVQNPDMTYSQHAYYYDSDPAASGVQPVAGPAPDTTGRTGDAGARIACGVLEEDPNPQPIADAAQARAQAELRNADGAVVGNVLFVPVGPVRVEVTVTGLSPGFRAIHVHDVGVCDAPGFTSAGGHYRGADTVHKDHGGDLPVILVRGDGNGTGVATTDRFTADALLEDDVSVVVHANADNYANIPATDVVNPDGTYAQRAYYYDYDGSGPGVQPAAGPAPDTTSRTGDAGSRVACGVVTRAGGGASPSTSPAPSPTSTRTPPPGGGDRVFSDTTVRIRHRTSPHQFFGRVSARLSACEPSRTLWLREVKGGRDPILARLRSDGSGRWQIAHRTGGPGRYYVVVRRRSFDSDGRTVVCRGALSRTLRVSE